MKRNWSEKTKLLNLFLFTLLASTGYVQYFWEGAPAYPSLWVGIGFTLILILYIYLVKQRKY